jgi:hypothetical protein
MRDEGVRVTLQVHPPSQDTASHRDQEPAVGAEHGDELISHRRDNRGIDGQKRKANRPTGVADVDPAVNEFLSQSRTDLLRTTTLTQNRKHALSHARSLTRPRSPGDDILICCRGHA